MEPLSEDPDESDSLWDRSYSSTTSYSVFTAITGSRKIDLRISAPSTWVNNSC